MGLLYFAFAYYEKYSQEVIEKIEMGGACGAYGGGERSAQGFGGET
jgi:hypothetical protein